MTIDENRIKELAREERVRTEMSEAYTRAHWAEQARKAAQPRRPDPAYEARQRQEEQAREAARAKLEERNRQREIERQQAIDEQLEPERQRQLRTWLAANPGKFESTFNTLVWPHLKANLLEGSEERALEEAKQRLLATGRYSL